MVTNEKRLGLESNEIEIRTLSNGNLEVIGKIEYNSRTHSLFHKNSRRFFVEQVNPRAFTKCLNRQKDNPQLLINHNINDSIKVVDFKYEDVKDEAFKFIYTIVPDERLLKNLHKITNFSFGFVIDEDEWYGLSNCRNKYLRKIKSFKVIDEFSLLIGQQSAYPSAKIYFGEDEIRKAEDQQIIRKVKELLSYHKQMEVEDLKRRLSALKA